MLHREDWTHYAQHDEARPGDLHLEWPESMRTVGLRGSRRDMKELFDRSTRNRMLPHSMDECCERKHGIKVPKSWGNAQERPSI